MLLELRAQGSEVQRLDHPCVHADGGTAFAFFAQGVGGDADDRQRRVLLAYSLGESVTIHDRHVDVGQQQIKRPGAHCAKGLFTIRGDDHRAAQCFQLFLDDCRVDHVVFGHQHLQIQWAGLCLQRGGALRIGAVLCQINSPGNRAHIVGVDRPVCTAWLRRIGAARNGDDPWPAPVRSVVERREVHQQRRGWWHLGRH